MTKEHESIFRGSLYEIHMLLKNKKINLLGEFVVAIYSELSAKQETNLDESFCKPFLDYLSPSDASKLIAKIINLPKQDIYKYLVEISK
jgi:16S rRNA C1402 (ribose-2'-O) methylase RsmI